jgi:hypothetical protein
VIDHSLAKLKAIGFSCTTYDHGSTLSDSDLNILKGMGLTRLRFINVLQTPLATVAGSTLTVTNFNDTFFSDGLTMCARLGLHVAVVLNTPPAQLIQLRDKIGVRIGVNSSATTYRLTIGASTISLTGRSTAQDTAVQLESLLSSAGAPFDAYAWKSDPNSDIIIGVAYSSATSNSVSSSTVGGTGTISSELNQSTHSTQLGKWRFAPSRNGTQDATDLELYTQYVKQVIDYIASFGISSIYLSVGNEWNIPGQDWSSPTYDAVNLGGRVAALAQCVVTAKSRYVGPASVKVIAHTFTRPYYPFRETAKPFYVAKAIKDAGVAIDYFDYHHYMNTYPGEVAESCNKSRQLATHWAVNQIRYSGLEIPQIWTEYGPSDEFDITYLGDKRGGSAHLACLKMAAEFGIKEAWPLLPKVASWTGDINQFYSLGFTKTGARSWPNKAWQQLLRVTTNAIPVKICVRQSASIVLASLDGFGYYRTGISKYVGIIWYHDCTTNAAWLTDPQSATATSVEIYIHNLGRALNISKYNVNDAASDITGSFATLSVAYGDFIYFEGT